MIMRIWNGHTEAHAAMIGRRGFLKSMGLSAGALAVGALDFHPKEEKSMYGLIGKMTAVPGKREALAEILLEGTADMPGCLSYVIAADQEDSDSLWITEVWDSNESHEASLKLPTVQEAISRGRPLIAEMSQGTVTTPLGGHGLDR